MNDYKWYWRIRWISYLYAWINSYFWLPCPLCGRHFGGHEWYPGNTLMISPYQGKGVCPRCGSEARRQNNIFRQSIDATSFHVQYFFDMHS